MKRILLLLLPLTALLSCHSDHKKANTDTIKKPNAATNQVLSKETLALIDEFKPIISGIWVRTDYITDLKKTLSPYKSSDKFGSVSGISIEPFNKRSDSTNIGYSLANHEGNSCALYFKRGSKPNSLKTGYNDYSGNGSQYELGYSIIKKDTSLILYSLDDKNKVIDKTFYKKVADKDNGESDAAWGINFYTKKLLVAGTYNFIDSLGKHGFCKFTAEGKLYGFGDFENYDIGTDFSVGPGNKEDQIFFNINTPKQKTYSFQIKADTLNIFEIDNIDTEDEKVGKLKYKLVRERP